jgi:hypothetical protein
MSGYIEAGYVIALGSLGSYALSLLRRERAARRGLPHPPRRAGTVPGSPAARDEPAEQP